MRHKRSINLLLYSQSVTFSLCGSFWTKKPKNELPPPKKIHVEATQREQDKLSAA